MNRTARPGPRPGTNVPPRGAPADVDTTREIPAPWLMPPATTEYATARVRLARLAAKLRASRLADDLRASYGAALTTFGAIGAGLLSLLFGIATYRLGELAHLVAIGAIR